MYCEKVKNLIFTYFDFGLNELDKEKLFKHLKDCEECQFYFNELKDLFAILKEEKALVENYSDLILSGVKGSAIVEQKKKPRRFFVLSPALGFSFMTILLLSFYLIFQSIMDSGISVGRQEVVTYSNGNDEINFVDVFLNQSYIYNKLDTVSVESEPYFDDVKKILSDIYKDMLHKLDMFHHENQFVIENSLEKMSDTELDLLIAELDTKLIEELP